MGWDDVDGKVGLVFEEVGAVVGGAGFGGKGEGVSVGVGVEAVGELLDVGVDEEAGIAELEGVEGGGITLFVADHVFPTGQTHGNGVGAGGNGHAELVGGGEGLFVEWMRVHTE